MREQLLDLLMRSPVPVPGVISMLEASRSSRLVIAGDENASVLTLMDGVGLGCPELALVQQPCVVEITRGEKLDIRLGAGGDATRCSSVSDLALRLTWPENRGASAQITCPHSLYGRDRLVFAVLDAQDFMAQLNQAAAGATGAVIVLDGYTAPSRAVYAYGKWLAEVCGLQTATAVLVHGKGGALNAGPAMALALQMGLPQLPTVLCDTTRESLRDALDKAAAAMTANEDGGKGLVRSAAQQAAQCLEAERSALLSAAPAVKPRRSLADCFEAEIAGARQEMERLIGSGMANQVYSEMRDFGIFLQGEIMEAMTSSVKALDEPKNALRAFSQGWLDDALSGYCTELINGLADEILMPEAQRIYDSIFERAWITREGLVGLDMDEQEMLRIQSTTGKLRQLGHSLLVGAISFVMTYVNPMMILNFKKMYRYSDVLAAEIQAAITPAGIYARTKARQLENLLEKVIAQYQDILTDTMLPQLRDELLGWFDAQTASDIALLRESDAQALRDYEQTGEQQADGRARAQEIGRFLEELAPYLA